MSSTRRVACYLRGCSGAAGAWICEGKFSLKSSTLKALGPSPLENAPYRVTSPTRVRLASSLAGGVAGTLGFPRVLIHSCECVFKCVSPPEVREPLLPSSPHLQGVVSTPTQSSGSGHTKMDRDCAVSPVPVVRPETQWAESSGPCLGRASLPVCFWASIAPVPRHMVNGRKHPFFHVSSRRLPV